MLISFGNKAIWLSTLAPNEIMFRAGEAGNKSDNCEVLLAVSSFLLQAGHTFVFIVKVLVLFTSERQGSRKAYSVLLAGKTPFPHHESKTTSWVGIRWHIALNLVRAGRLFWYFPHLLCLLKYLVRVVIRAWNPNKHGHCCPTGFPWAGYWEELWSPALDSLENLSQPFSVYGKPKMGTVILLAEWQLTNSIAMDSNAGRKALFCIQAANQLDWQDKAPTWEVHYSLSASHTYWMKNKKELVIPSLCFWEKPAQPFQLEVFT